MNTDIPQFNASRGRSQKARKTLAWRCHRSIETAVTRSLELVFGGLGLIVTTLVLPVLALRRRPVFVASRFVGRYGEPHTFYRFRVGPRWLRSLPVCLQVVRGNLALVGPRPLDPSEVSRLTPVELRRIDVRPGLVSLTMLRKNTNIAFESESAIENQYVEESSAKGDVGLLSRYLSTSWVSDAPSEYSPVVDLLGVPIQNVTINEAIDLILDYAAGGEARQICFVNADCINYTFKRADYGKVLVGADTVLADGIGVKLAGKLLKRPIVQNVNGTDLFPRLCERIASTSESIFLLGGREGVADGVREWVETHHPGTQIAGVQHGFFQESETTRVIEDIRHSKANILMVAFGAPKQDVWIAQHLDELGVGVAMGVGGLFDFYSDRIPRAPQWLRELGLEWMYRLIQEPGRMWKRYLVGNVVFLYRVFRFGKRVRRFM